MEKLIKIVNNFAGKKIGVIGDLMLDQFIWGKAERISPEAPVPVVLIAKETFMPGGAANTANNIAALGGRVSIVGTVGKDESGRQLFHELKIKGVNTDGILFLSNNPTIQKIRIIAQGQQIVRMDKENIDYIGKQAEQRIISFISSCFKEWDAVVISDYVKGLITKDLVGEIINLASKYQKPVIGNTKKPSHASYFQNVNLLIANSEEAEAISGREELKTSGKKIQEKLKCNVLITQGPKGMTLFERDDIRHFPTKAREVFNVSGAGDTVISALTLALISGANLKEAAIIANHAAGIVVGKLGTATISIKELKKSLENN